MSQNGEALFPDFGQEHAQLVNAQLAAEIGGLVIARVQANAAAEIYSRRVSVLEPRYHELNGQVQELITDIENLRGKDGQSRIEGYESEALIEELQRRGYSVVEPDDLLLTDDPPDGTQA